VTDPMAGSTVEKVAGFIAGSLRPLLASLDSNDATGAPMRRFVEGLGWSLPAGPVPPSLLALRPTIVSLVRDIGELSNLRMAGVEGETLDEVALATSLALIVADVAMLAEELSHLETDLAAELPGPYVAATHIDRDFGSRLLDALIVTAAYKRIPLVSRILRLLGIIEVTSQDPDPTIFQPAYTLRRARWDRIPQLLQHPDAVLRDVYGWGTPKIDLRPLLDALLSVSAALNAPGTVGYPSRGLMHAVVPTMDLDGVYLERMFRMPIIDIGLVRVDAGITPIPKADPVELQGVAVTLVANGGTLEFTIPLSQELVLILTGTLDASVGIALAIWPDKDPELVSDFDASRSPVSGAGLAARLEYSRQQPLPILTIPGGTGVDIRGAYFGGGVSARTNEPIDVSIEGGVTEARIIVTAGESDSFIAKILPEGGIQVPFEFTIGWSSARGVYFKGSAGLETTLALHLAIGPLLIETLHLAALLNGDGLAIEASVNASATIGPISASVERIGMSADVSFSPGNLGPLNIDFGFKPPNGLGLVVDAGPVTGGGFLSFDHPNGRYSGVIQLQVYSVAITAIGLLDTKLPGGQTGYSFLIIITAEFPPIQLGFGFTLNGAGGLAGINRTAVIDALQAGVRTGSIDHILFPEDPIRDAAIIISDLRTFFPPAQGRYVFGPIALIGYGTPTLITAVLGIVIELPSPIRLLLIGKIAALLPDPEAPVVELHLSILGVLDFEAKLLAIDASLHDSRVAAFSIYGDMALRLTWGDKPNFLLSVGGWNPHFDPPAGFPELRRMTVALGDGENPRITLQGYFAITSNSAQVGARAELYAAKGGFNVAGWVGFDAIFIFTPFSFRTDFSAGVAIRRGSSTLASVHLDATLTGPSPFHAWGEASLSLLFFHVSVPFDATFGESRQIEAPDKDPWELLEPAVRDPRNWSVELPPGAHTVVALRKPSPDSTRVVLDPAGSAIFRQKVVPLNFPIDKFGEATPIGAGRYDVSSVVVENVPLAANERATVRDLFARGQYRRMSDHDKLSIPAFEPLDSGIRITETDVGHGEPLGRDVEYETHTLDSEWESRTTATPYRPSRAKQIAMVGASAKVRSMIENSGSARFGPPPNTARQFGLNDEQYQVVLTDDLSPEPGILGAPSTQGLARDALADHLARNPQDRGKYQVVPTHEAVAA